MHTIGITRINILSSILTDIKMVRTNTGKVPIAIFMGEDEYYLLHSPVLIEGIPVTLQHGLSKGTRYYPCTEQELSRMKYALFSEYIQFPHYPLE